MSKWLSKRDLSRYNAIKKLIEKMENYFIVKQKYVTYKALDLSDKETVLIDEYSDIFFKCSPTRYVLVKWIVDETENFFRKNNASAVNLDKLYYFLRNRFKTGTFNKYNLQKLFKAGTILEYSSFVSVRNTVLSEYKRFHSESKDIAIASELKNADRLKKIIYQIFPNSFVNNGSKKFWYEEFDLSSDEIEIKNSLQRAKEDLGDELCIDFLKNTNKTLYLLKVLSYYADIIEYNNKLKTAIKNVCESLLPARLKPLLFAYEIDNELRSNLVKLFEDNNILLVKELPGLLEVSIDNTIASPLYNFVYWLSDDKISVIKQNFTGIFKNERDMSILKMRLAGETLEATGQIYSLTRERVRQIEQRILTKFNSFITRIKPHFILQAYTKSDIILTIQSIKIQLGELSDMFIYCLKECKSKKIKWNDKLNGFVIGDSRWLEQLSKYVDTLPKMIEISDLDSYVSKIKNLIDVNVDFGMIREFIISHYSLYGNFYSKRKINMVDIYSLVLERYYPSGIKLFDDFEMMRFRNYVKELFGDVDLPENDKAICARIAAITILCDRGKYILPSQIRCDDNILNRIYQFIVDSERNVIMFSELFERFRSELLETTSINNRYYLQGVLKYKYGNEFFFTKDTIIKDINSEQDVRLYIEEFIKEQGRIVSKDELKKEFIGITDAVLLSSIASNPNILLWDFGKYLHAKQLIVDDTTKDRLKNLLDDYIIEGSVSVRKIYDDIYLSENDFLLSNNIDGHIALFSVFNYLFPDGYEFSRPFIAPKGSTALSFDKVIREYLSSFDEVYISDLKDYVESMKKCNFSVVLLLDDISDEFIRVDRDLLIRKNRLHLSKDVIESIEGTTMALVGKTGYLSVKKIVDYLLYPDIGVKWTPFLLVSIIKYYCKQLRIVNAASDYRYVNEIIVAGSMNIDDYDELLRYALKQEASHLPFKNMQEIKDFLLGQELIVNNIPQSLFEKGYLLEEEYGGITIV